MARLNDENLSNTEFHASDHILSPQPFAPPGKELLVTSLETAHLTSEAVSTIDDGQMSTQSYEYSSSGSSTRHSTSGISGQEMDDELEHMKSRASSRSSLSSMPASVLVHPADHMKQMSTMGIHEQLARYSIEEDEANFGGFDRPPQSIQTIRQREAAFRKPSSVRAMQMHTEDEADEDEFLTPPRRRQGMRSPGTSPLKRSPYYSPKTAQTKPSVKKEYPLVLLHCTLLAPSLPVPGASDLQNQKIVEEVLPPQYWRRWRRLQDKVGSGVLRDRGVLISHPEDLYDMLEERLLESLELQRPLVHRGHFIGHEEVDPGSEGEVSDREESETDGEQGDECPDCGGRVFHQSDTNRKWEIRVYAANGLMRAGAWAAAWKEMEKVDVEVGVWLPSDIRRLLEKRLAEQQMALSTEHAHSAMVFNDSEKLGMDPRRLSVQTYARTFSDAGSFRSSGHPMQPQIEEKLSDLPQTNLSQGHEIALRTLLINYIRVLAGDRRNVALVFLSILVIFLAVGFQPHTSHPGDVLQSFTHEEFFGAPVAAKMEVQVDVPVLSVTSSSASLLESIIPTSSVVATMLESASAAPSHTQRDILPSAVAESELMAANPGPTPEIAPLERVHDEEMHEEKLHAEETYIEETYEKVSHKKENHKVEEAHEEEAHEEEAHEEEAHEEEAHEEEAHEEEAHEEEAHEEEAHEEEVYDDQAHEGDKDKVEIHEDELRVNSHRESQAEPVKAIEDLSWGETKPVEAVEEPRAEESEPHTNSKA
ncbi:hypothetical protein F1880_006075 [Penicillium rolfsii]|nr:hypothetical protein F1880_006075 [Penicillium rolfsii]